MNKYLPPEPMAFYLRGTDVTPVEPDVDVADAKDLPDALVIEPGVYRVHGRILRLEQEGLYRFLWLRKDNLQRVVYKQDVTAFVSAMCWIHSHGSRDDKTDYADLVELAKSGKVIMTCGPYCNFTAEFFEKHGVRARAIGTGTMEGRNGANDGHILLEAYVDGRWILYDVDGHAIYRHQGRHLNLQEAVRQIQEDDYEVEPLSGSVRKAVGSFCEGGYDFGLWMETTICGDRGWRRWRRRVMGVPRMFNRETNKNEITCPESERAKAEEAWPELVWVPADEFRRRHYSP